MVAMLYPGEQVIDGSNYQSVCGDGEKIVVAGETYFLSARPPAAGEIACAAPCSIDFAAAGLRVYTRQELAERIKEQTATKARNSDYQDYPAKNQAQTNYCWMNGPCGAMTTRLKRQTGVYIEMSSAAAAGPYTRFRNVGGNEVPGLEWLVENGTCDAKIWPNAAIDRKYQTDLVVQQRQLYKPTEYITLSDDKEERMMQYLSGLVDGLQGAHAYYWMRHVMEGADAVLLDDGSFGLRNRNSWGEGDGVKNDFGYGGYRVYKEGKGSPDSGFLLREVLAV